MGLRANVSGLSTVRSPCRLTRLLTVVASIIRIEIENIDGRRVIIDIATVTKIPTSINYVKIDVPAPLAIRLSRPATSDPTRIAYAIIPCRCGGCTLYVSGRGVCVRAVIDGVRMRESIFRFVACTPRSG